MNNNNVNNNGNDNKSFEEKAKELINDVADDSASFTKEEIESGKGLSIISYISALSLISLRNSIINEDIYS